MPNIILILAASCSFNLCILLFYNMPKYRFILAILLTLSTLTSYAQPEEWDMYMATINNKPASVLVDMGLYKNAPDTRYPYVVITGPRFKNCKTNGLPETEELPKLEEILDASTAFLSGVTAKVLAGTITHNCQRNNYYYVKDTANVRNALIRLYKRNYSDYNYGVIIKYEASWLNYISVLYPTDNTKNWMDNQKILASLVQQGVDVHQKQHIKHVACFAADTTSVNFITKAQSLELNAMPLKNLMATKLPYCISINQVHTLQIDSICKETILIKNLVADFKGIYHGWQVTSY